MGGAGHDGACEEARSGGATAAKKEIVDLLRTMRDPQGREVDMGSGFDEMSLTSHPAMNDEHLALGVLTAAQVTERGWLHAAMARGGF